MAGPTQIEQLRQKLGAADGPVVRDGVGKAFDYFKDVLGVNPLDAMHVQYIRGIDFHRQVTVRALTPGAMLVRFPEIVAGVVKPERLKPYRFFAAPGATPLHLGWNQDEMGFQLYRLQESVCALVSFASAIRFGDTRSRLGGDRQIVIPSTTSVAMVHERDFDRQKIAEMFRLGYLPLGLP